jgi:hypothetical protein
VSGPSNQPSSPQSRRYSWALRGSSCAAAVVPARRMCAPLHPLEFALLYLFTHKGIGDAGTVTAAPPRSTNSTVAPPRSTDKRAQKNAPLSLRVPALRSRAAPPRPASSTTSCARCSSCRTHSGCCRRSSGGCDQRYGVCSGRATAMGSRHVPASLRRATRPCRGGSTCRCCSCATR